MIAESMETCVEVLYELKKIDGQKRTLLLDGIKKDNFAVYVEITNLLNLIG